MTVNDCVFSLEYFTYFIVLLCVLAAFRQLLLNEYCIALPFRHFSRSFLLRDASLLCVSAVFAVAWCLSVTLVDCIQTAKDIVKLFSRPSSPIILVFDLQRPSAGTQNTRGWENFAIID